MLEQNGFYIGSRLIERLMLIKPIVGEQIECVKFICKDFWILLFQKQADRLQTNCKGEYVIQEKCLGWIKYMVYGPGGTETNEDSVSVEDLTALLIALACGIIRGALTCLGFPCIITAEYNSPPACSFQIRMT